QGHHAAVARVEEGRDPLDAPTLSRRVPSFEDDHDAQALVADPLLQLDQLHLEPAQLFLVALLVELDRVAILVAGVLALLLLFGGDRHGGRIRVTAPLAEAAGESEVARWSWSRTGAGNVTARTR